MKKPRFVYAVAFCILLFVEILIGLFVHDDFIRPYIGDVLVTVLICCLCRIMIPKGVSALPIYVFVFSTLVEIGQYFELIKVLGLEDNAFISTIVGTTFSVMDLVCYAVGCIAFWATEKAIYGPVSCGSLTVVKKAVHPKSICNCKKCMLQFNKGGDCVKKKVFIIIGIFILSIALFVGIYKIANPPVRYFRGEIVKIEDNDKHLVFTVKENEDTLHTVHVIYIHFITYRGTEKGEYAHNIETGIYIEGNYYHDWWHKREFAEKIEIIENF